jgi:hypothetical protein
MLNIFESPSVRLSRIPMNIDVTFFENICIILSSFCYIVEMIMINR